MGRIKKEKFNWDGTAMKPTTFSGDFELELHYNVSKDIFYFEGMKDIFTEEMLRSISFDKCRSRQEAINRVKVALHKTEEVSRLLQIRINVKGAHEELAKANPIVMDEYMGKDSSHGIVISFTRYKKFVCNEKIYSYSRCNDNWEEAEKRFRYTDFETRNNFDGVVMDWSQELEDFLMVMQRGMDDMCLKVINFFNTKNKEELLQRIKSIQGNLLEQPKGN